MNIHHLLYFCFLSVLTDGNTGLVNEKTLIHTEGESAIAECHFTLSGRRKFFCKDECTEEDILVETKGDTAQRGRYSIEYKEGTFPVSSSVVYVGIAQLNKSDAGWYKCGLERPYMPDSYSEFELKVTDAPKMFPETMKQHNEETAAVHRLKVSYPPYGLPLAICVTVLFAAVVLLLYKLNTRMGSDGLNSRGRSEDRNMEFAVCEKCATASKRADSTALARDESCSNEDKIYCNL